MFFPVGASKDRLMVETEILKSAADQAPEDEEHPSTYLASFKILTNSVTIQDWLIKFYFGIGVESFHTFLVDYSKVPKDRFENMRRGFHAFKPYQSLSLTTAMRATESAELEFWVELDGDILSKSGKVKASWEDA